MRLNRRGMNAGLRLPEPAEGVVGDASADRGQSLRYAADRRAKRMGGVEGNDRGFPGAGRYLPPDDACRRPSRRWFRAA